MNLFLQLEGGNLTIALFFLLIAIFVATRPFVRPQVKRFILGTVILGFGILITGHYIVTMHRMEGVKKAFANGREVECESRMNRKAAQSVIVSKAYGWELHDDLFTHPEYTRPFHAARCILRLKLDPKKLPVK